MKTKSAITLAITFILSCLIINAQEKGTDAELKYKGLRKLDDNRIIKPFAKLSLESGLHIAETKYGIGYSSGLSLAPSIYMVTSDMKSQFKVQRTSSGYYCSQNFLSDARFNAESGKSYLTETINCNYIDTVTKSLYFNWPYFHIIEKDTKKEAGGIINTERIIGEPPSPGIIHLYPGNIESEESLTKFSVNFYCNCLTHLIGRTIDGYNVNYCYEYRDTDASSALKQVTIYLKPGYYCFTQIFSEIAYLFGKWYQNGYSVSFKAEPNQLISNNQGLSSYDDRILQCNQPSFLSLVTTSLNDIYFLPDGKHGWIVGDNGIILRTRDGGNNWTFHKNKLGYENPQAKDMNLIGSGIIKTHPDFSKVYFIDTLNGWATIKDGKLLEMVNGGSLLLEDGGILKTVDGGVTWLSQKCKACNGGLFFINENEGYTVSNRDRILSTIDGGIKWETIHYTPVLSDFYLRDSNDWKKLKGGMTGGFFQSIDKGLTWEEKNSDMHRFAKNYLNQDVFFVDQNTGWILMQNEFMIGDVYAKKMLYTENNGLTWTSYEIPMSDIINSICFSDKNKGYVVGDNGNIYKTNNGGKTWEKIRSGTLENLKDVLFIQKNGWIIGSNGGILESNDEGATWKYVNVFDFVND